MPELTSTLSAISTVGFPIVCCIAMALYVKYITDKNREEVAELNKQHKTEIGEVVTAIQNNTLVIQKLTDVLTLGGDLNGRQDSLHD